MSISAKVSVNLVSVVNKVLSAVFANSSSSSAEDLIVEVSLSQLAISSPIAMTIRPMPVAASASLNALSAPVEVPTTAAYAACAPVAILVAATPASLAADATPSAIADAPIIVLVVSRAFWISSLD